MTRRQVRGVLNEEQFRCLLEIKDADPHAPSNKAAFVVLVEAKSQAEAAREHKVAATTINTVISRLLKTYDLIDQAFLHPPRKSND